MDRHTTNDLLHPVLSQARVQTYVCTRQRRQKGYILERRVLSDYNLIYVLHGKPVWVMDSEDVPLSPGDLLVVPPHVPHHGFSTTQRVNLLSVHVEVTLPGGQDVFDLLRPPRKRSVDPKSALARYFEGFNREFTPPADTFAPSALPLRQGWGHLIALQLFREDAEHNRLDPATHNPLVIETMGYLATHLASPITQRDLARHTGYSPQHLNRIFQQSLGVTPLQHLARLRIDRARDLLTADKLTIQAISERVGFTDPFYFSRVFNEQTGMSPSAYRRETCSDYPA